MKREFLEGLGISKELIDPIMSEYGKSLTALKEKLSSAEQKEKELDALKKEYENVQSALEKEREAHLIFKSGLIKDLISSAKPSSSLAEKELERILFSTESGELASTLKKIRNENPDAFLHEEHSYPQFSSTLPSEDIEGYENIRLRNVR